MVYHVANLELVKQEMMPMNLYLLKHKLRVSLHIV
jgi:hypothetical protein